jgi:hypothetical protein
MGECCKKILKPETCLIDNQDFAWYDLVPPSLFQLILRGAYVGDEMCSAADISKTSLVGLVLSWGDECDKSHKAKLERKQMIDAFVR